MEHINDPLQISELAGITFIKAENLQPRLGLKTGIEKIDSFLLWQGIPLGELSLFQGLPGSGSTSLWTQCLSQVHKNNKWAAWINNDCNLFPAHLQHLQIDLGKLLVAKTPASDNQLFWLLQELISSELFEIIGCTLNSLSLKKHQLQKLKRLCKTYKVSLVFINQKPLPYIDPLFALCIDFLKDSLTIQRALHRPTPFHIKGNIVHASLMPQLKDPSRTLLA